MDANRYEDMLKEIGLDKQQIKKLSKHKKQVEKDNRNKINLMVGEFIIIIHYYIKDKTCNVVLLEHFKKDTSIKYGYGKTIITVETLINTVIDTIKDINTVVVDDKVIRYINKKMVV